MSHLWQLLMVGQAAYNVLCNQMVAKGSQAEFRSASVESGSGASVYGPSIFSTLVIS